MCYLSVRGSASTANSCSQYLICICKLYIQLISYLQLLTNNYNYLQTMEERVCALLLEWLIEFDWIFIEFSLNFHWIWLNFHWIWLNFHWIWLNFHWIFIEFDWICRRWFSVGWQQQAEARRPTGTEATADDPHIGAAASVQSLVRNQPQTLSKGNFFKFSINTISINFQSKIMKKGTLWYITMYVSYL